jgi:hypothetical protein
MQLQVNAQLFITVTTELTLIKVQLLVGGKFVVTEEVSVREARGVRVCVDVRGRECVGMHVRVRRRVAVQREWIAETAVSVVRRRRCCRAGQCGLAVECVGFGLYVVESGVRIVVGVKSTRAPVRKCGWSGWARCVHMGGWVRHAPVIGEKTRRRGEGRGECTVWGGVRRRRERTRASGDLRLVERRGRACWHACLSVLGVQWGLTALSGGGVRHRGNSRVGECM